MKELPFVFTIVFLTLGPTKLIHSFGTLTRNADGAFKRAVAIRGAIIASLVCAFVFLAGERMLGKYHISLDAVRIGGGLVLLISALLAIFHWGPEESPGAGTPSALQLGASVAVPNIVSSPGVAAILIGVMLAPQFPGIEQAVALSLAVIMVVNFLVMYLIDSIVRIPGLGLLLKVLGAVLVFVQVALAVQMILTALTSMGVIRS